MSGVSLAQSLVTMQTEATRQALSVTLLRQDAQAEQSLVALLRQSVEQGKATLPQGQGGQVDLTV